MKKTLLLGASLLCSVFIMATEIPFQKAEIKSIMRKVADWQIANPHPAPEHDDLNWPQGALYVGMVDWAELAEKEDNDDTYYKWLTRIGRRNCWQPDKRFYHADDIAVSQSFLDLPDYSIRTVSGMPVFWILPLIHHRKRVALLSLSIPLLME